MSEIHETLRCVSLYIKVPIFIGPQAYTGDRGSTVGKVLCYKSEGLWFDPSWCQFIDIKLFLSHYGSGVDSASSRNEYQELFLGVKAAGA